MNAYLYYATYVLVFIFFYGFSSPFLGNRALREQALSFYVWSNLFLLVWLITAALLHLPFFSYETELPVAFFLPVFMATSGVLFAVEALLKVLNQFYVSHVGLPRAVVDIMNNSFSISLACCVLFYSCTHGEWACTTLTRFVPEGWHGVSPVFVLWSTLVSIVLLQYAAEKLLDFRVMAALPSTRKGRRRDEEKKEEFSFEMLPMSPWYDLVLVLTGLDLLISLKVFLGRFDIRALLPAMHPGGLHVHDHLRARDRKELWFDWMADTGDGWDSTYHVARKLAMPALDVHAPGERAPLVLPRAKLLMLGGDLAYSRPTEETFRDRFFRPFCVALPRKLADGSPAPVVPDVCVDKPDIDVGLDAYEGPECWSIPGNHDMLDGLDQFTKHIVFGGWLGGWLLPQTSSYFALALPQGWWLFGLDIGLNHDIDAQQFGYFYRIVCTRMARSDRAIVCTHEPDWSLAAYEGEARAANIYRLVDAMGGRCKLRLAGDLHNFQKHEPLLCRKPPPHTPRNDDKKEEKEKGEEQAHTEPLMLWDADAVCAWLRGAGLGVFEDTFRRQRVDGRLLARLDARAHAAALACAEASSLDWTRLEAALDGLRSTRRTLAEPPPLARCEPPLLITSGGGGAFMHGTQVPGAGVIEVGPDRTPYERTLAYPSVAVSERYALMNVIGFRRRNFRFDLFTGVVYFLMVISLLPLCSTEHIRAAGSWWMVGTELGWTVWMVHAELFRSTYSLTMFLLLCLVSIAFTDNTWPPKWRVGAGIGLCLVHSAAAIFIVVVLEISLDAFIDARLVDEHLLAKLLRLFPQARYPIRFLDDLLRYVGAPMPPAPNGVVEPFLGLLARTVDVPYTISNLKRQYCTELSVSRHTEFLDSISAAGLPFVMERVSTIAYYLSFFAYFWLLATPAGAIIFGSFLYVSVNFLHSHWDEAFSALRIDSYKNFLRMHIRADGALEVFVLGMDHVPHLWRKRKAAGGGARRDEPSLLVPDELEPDQVKLVDRFVIEK